MSKTNEIRLIDANALRKKTYPFPCAIGVEYAVPLRAIDEAPTLTLNTLRDAIYQDAVAHGLWESTDYTVNTSMRDMEMLGDPFDPDEVMRDYAIETIRWELTELNDAIDNAEAYTEELADVIIAALSVAGKLGIDIEAAVKRKMEINRSRPWKHGKEG